MSRDRRYKRRGDDSVRGFLNSILYFALIMIVIYVLLGWAYAKESGEPFNIVYEFGKATKLFWTHLTSGWNS